MAIPYPLATPSWDEKEKTAAIEVIKSGNCTMGPITKKFEHEFAKFVGSKYAVFSNSGSSANLLAITSLMYRNNGPKLSSGDEVLVPAVSWSTTYFPIHQNNLKIRFVDININTLNIDIDKLKTAITPKTKAVFAVHLLGNPNLMNSLLDICKKYNLLLIEDTCESLGALYNKKQCGTFGIIGTYSTFFSHHMSTTEGGICVTDDEEIYQIMLSLRAHGWTRNLPAKNHIHNKDGIPFNDLFRFVLPGYNVRPNDIFAAIGLEQLKKLPEFLKIRKENYNNFVKELNNTTFGNNMLIQQEYTNAESSWFGFSIILNGELSGQRENIINHLTEHGIECRPIVAGNFTKNPVIKHLNYSINESLEISEKIDKDGFFIGNNPQDLSKEIHYFFYILKEIL